MKTTDTPIIRADAHKKMIAEILYPATTDDRVIEIVRGWRTLVSVPADYVQKLFTGTPAVKQEPTPVRGFWEKRWRTAQDKLAATEREVARLQRNETSAMRSQLDDKREETRDLKANIVRLHNLVHDLSALANTECVCHDCSSKRQTKQVKLRRRKPTPGVLVMRNGIVAGIEAMSFLSDPGPIKIIVRAPQTGNRYRFEFPREAIDTLMGDLSLEELSIFEKSLKAFGSGEDESERARAFAVSKVEQIVTNHTFRFHILPKIDSKYQRRLQLAFKYPDIKPWEIGKEKESPNLPSTTRRRMDWSDEELVYLSEQYEKLGGAYRKKMDYTHRIKLAELMETKFGPIRDWKGEDAQIKNNCGVICRGLMTLWQRPEKRHRN